MADVPMSIIVLSAVALVIVGVANHNSMGGLVGTRPVVADAITLWLMIFLPGVRWAVWHWLQLCDEPLWRCLIAGGLYPSFLLGVIATWRGLAGQLSGRHICPKPAPLAETQPSLASPRLL